MPHGNKKRTENTLLPIIYKSDKRWFQPKKELFMKTTVDNMQYNGKVWGKMCTGTWICTEVLMMSSVCTGVLTHKGRGHWQFE